MMYLLACADRTGGKRPSRNAARVMPWPIGSAIPLGGTANNLTTQSGSGVSVSTQRSAFNGPANTTGLSSAGVVHVNTSFRDEISV